MVAGVASAVAGAALVALAVLLKRRRASKQTTIQSSSVPHDNNNLEEGDDQPLDHAGLPTSAVPAVKVEGDKSSAHQGNVSPYFFQPGDADLNGEDINPKSAPSPFDGAADTEASGAGLTDVEGAAVDSADKPLTANAPIGTVSTATMSTAERGEVFVFRQRLLETDPPRVIGGLKPKGEDLSGGGSGASPAASRQGSAGDIGLGQAVLAAAQELARSCQIPGVSEAAGAVCIMANLFLDNLENDKASTFRLRQCRSMVLALKRADKVVGKVSR